MNSDSLVIGVLGGFVLLFILGIGFSLCEAIFWTTTQRVSCAHVTGDVVINGASTRVTGGKGSVDISDNRKKLLTWPHGALAPTFIDNSAVTLDRSVAGKCTIRWGRNSELEVHVNADGSLK